MGGELRLGFTVGGIAGADVGGQPLVEAEVLDECAGVVAVLVGEDGELGVLLLRELFEQPSRAGQGKGAVKECGFEMLMKNRIGGLSVFGTHEASQGEAYAAADSVAHGFVAGLREAELALCVGDTACDCCEMVDERAI